MRPVWRHGAFPGIAYGICIATLAPPVWGPCRGMRIRPLRPSVCAAHRGGRRCGRRWYGAQDLPMHWPPWPNGQGVGLLIRRLRVRVPQGVQLGRVPVGFGLPQLAWRKVGTTPGAIGRALSLSLSLSSSLPLSPFPAIVPLSFPRSTPIRLLSASCARRSREHRRTLCNERACLSGKTV